MASIGLMTSYIVHAESISGWERFPACALAQFVESACVTCVHSVCVSMCVWVRGCGYSRVCLCVKIAQGHLDHTKQFSSNEAFIAVGGSSFARKVEMSVSICGPTHFRTRHPPLPQKKGSNAFSGTGNNLPALRQWTSLIR
jgi:hypothetical protein